MRLNYRFNSLIWSTSNFSPISSMCYLCAFRSRYIVLMFYTLKYYWPVWKNLFCNFLYSNMLRPGLVDLFRLGTVRLYSFKGLTRMPYLFLEPSLPITIIVGVLAFNILLSIRHLGLILNLFCFLKGFHRLRCRK